MPVTRPPGSAVPADQRDALRDEIRRGRRLDRELAGRLGRPAPPDRGGGGSYLDRLHGDQARRQPDAALVAAAQSGDPAARARLIEACMPMIAAAARTYRSPAIERQELLQEGAVGVLRALERYDAARGVPFWGYATWWVRQAMQQLVSELTRPVVLSDRALRNLSRLKQAHHEAVQSTGRTPARGELAERSGLTLEQVDDLLATERVPRSLEAPATAEGEVGAFGELLRDPLAEDAYEAVVEATELEELHGLLAGLSEREREILRRRYGVAGETQSLREIGEQLGLSGERVRQLERRAIGKLAAAVGAD